MGGKRDLRDNYTKRHRMTTDRLKYLLDRYLDNTATPEELQEYDEWCRQQASMGEEVFDQGYSRELFKGIMNKIGQEEGAAVTAPATRKRYIHYIRWAAAALVTGAAFMLFNTIKPKQGVTIAQKGLTDKRVKQEMVMIENRTAVKKQVQLKDGSLAELFAGSTLRYKEPFGKEDRNIYLSGKGFFDVAKNPEKPFTVYSQGISTTALGTSFTVTAYIDKQEVTVTLHSGRVVVKRQLAQHSRKEIYLQPGQQLSCNTTTGIARVAQITGTEAGTGPLALGSRTGVALTFDQAPLDSVLQTISEGYNVHVQYNQEEMSAMLFSGSIRETDSLSQVLRRIAVLYNLSVKPSTKQFIIRKSH